MYHYVSDVAAGVRPWGPTQWAKEGRTALSVCKPSDFASVGTYSALRMMTAAIAAPELRTCSPGRKPS